MTRYVKLTIEVLLAVSFGLGAYDIWVGWTAGGDATISEILALGSQRWPTIPFAMGYLCGHLFAQMGPSPTMQAIKAVHRYAATFWG